MLMFVVGCGGIVVVDLIVDVSVIIIQLIGWLADAAYLRGGGVTLAPSGSGGPPTHGLCDRVVRFQPTLARIYKTKLNAYCISLVEISHKTKKFFPIKRDFRPIKKMCTFS